MINLKFLVCTECQKNKRRKSKQFISLRGMNIHLAIVHKSKYKITYYKGKLVVLRLKRTPKKNNLLT